MKPSEDRDEGIVHHLPWRRAWRCRASRAWSAAAPRPRPRRRRPRRTRPRTASSPPAKQDAAASAEGAPSSVSHQQQLRPATATGSRGRAGGASPRPGRIAEILGRGGAARSPAAAGRPAPGAWRPASGWLPLGAALSGAAADREGDGGEPRRDLNRGGGREGVRRRWRQAPAPAFFCSLSFLLFCLLESATFGRLR